MKTFESFDPVGRPLVLICPDGFSRVSWDDLEMNDEVYTAMTKEGGPPTGPYLVYDAENHKYASATTGSIVVTDIYDSMLVKDS